MAINQKPQKCPKCGEQALYNNKGVSAKNNRPYENWKCSKCQFLQWVQLKDTQAGNTPVPAPATHKVDSSLVLADEISAMRLELKDLIKFLKESLGDGL